MAIIPAEIKEFVFTNSGTTVTKKFTSSIAYTVVIRRGDLVLNLTGPEFDAFFEVVSDANDQQYTDPV